MNIGNRSEVGITNIICIDGHLESIKARKFKRESGSSYNANPSESEKTKKYWVPCWDITNHAMQSSLPN